MSIIDIEQARRLFTLAEDLRKAQAAANAADQHGVYAAVNTALIEALTAWSVVAFNAEEEQAEAIAQEILSESLENGENLAYCVGVFLRLGFRHAQPNVALLVVERSTVIESTGNPRRRASSASAARNPGWA